MYKCEMCGNQTARKEFYAWTGWTVEDVRTLDESISADEARKLLTEYEEDIEEAMINAGWWALEYAVGIWHAKKKRKEITPCQTGA